MMAIDFAQCFEGDSKVKEHPFESPSFFLEA